jgi:IS5 family transposase
MDIDNQLIREIETTHASMHDSQIDLTKPGEVSYRDRRYFGALCKGYNATMNRATRGHPLNIREKNAKSTHNTQKSTRRTTICRN